MFLLIHRAVQKLVLVQISVRYESGNYWGQCFNELLDDLTTFILTLSWLVTSDVHSQRHDDDIHPSLPGMDKDTHTHNTQACNPWPSATQHQAEVVLQLYVSQEL